MAGRALSPIAQIITTAEEISAQNLDRRIEYEGAPDEVGRLAKTMDTMFDRLQSAFDLERRFTGDAAHELRTPLTALKGKIDVTLSRDRHPDDYANAVATMGVQVDRLIRLSNDLLFMARFEQPDQGKTNPTFVNLGDLVNSVVDQIHPMLVAKQLMLTEHVAPNLTLNGDTDLLIRLFLNLLDNAIKYTPENGTITIRAQCSSSGIEVQIQDSGIGIPTEDLPHLFTRFYRVEQDRSRLTGTTTGSGLGLAIAQEIVHAHSGTISATSTLAADAVEPATAGFTPFGSAPVDHGTTITIHFPL